MCQVSGDCGYCGAPIKFQLDAGGEEGLIPLTGSPLHRVCARRLGFNVDLGSMAVCHREPRCVTRTWPRGRSTDAQILDYASSGRPFDDDEDMPEPVDLGTANLRRIARGFFEGECPHVAPGPLRLLIATAQDSSEPDLQAQALEMVAMIAGLFSNTQDDSKEDVRWDS